MKNNTWKKMDYSDTSMLHDHQYYLVTHKEYKTPMKAKWHSDEGGMWEVIGTTNNGRIDKEYWYSWDEQNPIIAWMEMPEIYEMENNAPKETEIMKPVRFISENEQAWIDNNGIKYIRKKEKGKWGE